MPTHPSRHRWMPGSGKWRAVGAGRPSAEHVLDHEHRVRERADEALLHREVDVDGLATADRGPHRGESGRGGERAGRQLVDVAADLDRVEARDPVGTHPAGGGLEREAAHPQLRIGPPLAEVGDPHKREDGLLDPEAGEVDPDALQAPGAQALDDHVGVGHGPMQPGPALLTRQVDRRAALAPVEEVEQQPAGGDLVVAERIAPGRLDLADVGAQVGQQLGGVRRARTPADLDDPQLPERTHSPPT